ncbi:MAG: ADOP family duplicated permease [Gemmatimonadales bacterium]
MRYTRLFRFPWRRREEIRRDVEDELAFHLEMRAGELRAKGTPAGDAERLARAQFGDLEFTREYCNTMDTRGERDVRRVERAGALWQDLRLSGRVLRKSPGFAVVAVLTLALGLGSTTAMFSLVNGVILRPLPYGNPGRLVSVMHDLPPINMLHTQVTVGTYFTYRRLARTIDGIGAWEDGAVNVAEPGGAGEPQRVGSAWISASIVPVLQVPPLRGRTFSDAEDRPKGPDAVIISEGMWRNRFGAAENILERSMEVNGKTRRIVGVMPRRFRFPDARTELWLPLALDPDDKFAGGFNENAVARLKPGVAIADAQRDFAAALSHWPELFPMMAPGVTTKMVMEQAKPLAVLQPLQEYFIGGIARTLWMLAAAAGLVLLVACANVANLILVRTDGRQREIAVREALGAGRSRVMLYFFAESLHLASGAAVLGLGLAWLAVRALVVAGPAALPRLAEVGIDWATVGFALAAALLVALVCSALPMLRIGRGRLQRALREGGRSGTASKVQQRVRGALVAAQMALALVVLAGSGLLVRTFERLSAVRPGFDPDQVATLWISLPGAKYKSDTSVARFYAELTDRVAAIPGVTAVGLTSRLPLVSHGMNQNPLYPEGDTTYNSKIPVLQAYTSVNADYFRAMGIPLIAGRTFGRLDVQRGDEAVVSRQVAQTFYHDSTGASVLGKRFRALPGGPWQTIVGVVGDVRDTALIAEPSRSVYFPEAVGSDTVDSPVKREMALVVRTQGDPSAITGPVQGVVRALDPTLPTFEIRSMTAVVKASMAQLVLVSVILGSAAVVTLALGAIGLYGVLAYVVTLRTRELGVRIALGAQPGQVTAMMTRQGLVLACVGVGGGLALFALVSRFLKAFLFGVAPGDPVVLGVASVVLLWVAGVASWVPARRAARIDPAEALRAE